MTLSHSLQHELAARGVRIQAVLPGATATEIWDCAGFPIRNLQASIVMSADTKVGTALVGLDNGEGVTIPPLQDGDAWLRFEAARQALAPQLGHSMAAPRYSL